ncbi:spliceosome-associated protein CWC27 homolog isoform X1 [Vanessa cardui]|uniref:spliceosome-associated protein CWC27 homolog isoform X1 n=1 Tax=Vanessa cardui TaxID=171605 RepID=UPI001F13E823|nr:spliceosome-associated protein CWC27 homolog isoform X1 [Vanessa cardui]
MSNIYIQEPPALGKVLLKTTAGDIDIELWTKETPKASRNFIQLCLEGYYNGTIFHRVVPGFIVQGGDPNGNGTGGESVYGEPFKDEFHSRLRFNRRGLVAMANAGKDDNGSQFFFTLAATPELQNKHTIFGKVTGDTIYNVLKLSEGLIGPDEKPEHPNKILNTLVLINPFTDIVPRVQEKPQDQDVDKSKKKKRERQGVKNFGLLSFGEEAEEDEGEAQEFRGKPKSTHDLLEDPKLSKKTAAELELEEQNEKEEQSSKENDQKKEETAQAVSNIREKLKNKEAAQDKEGSGARKRGQSPDEDEEDSKRKKESDDEEYYLGKERDMERAKERDRIRNEIKKLRKEMRGAKEEPKDDKIEEHSDSKKLEEENEMYKKFIEEQEKYKKMKEKIPKKGAARSRTKFTRKTPKKKVWSKNLYENRDYPDNYTDGKFLEDLRKNLFVEKVTLKQAVLGSFRVVLRLCLCVLYAILFVYMYNKWVHTHTVIYLSITIAFVCYILYICVEGGAFLRHFKIVLVYLVIGYILSPILHTLTDTVSTDTIYAWAVIMMLVHLMFFDYDVPAAFVSKSLSINAAIFASVCLVSRLSTPFDAFVLLTISVIFFVLSPQLFQALLRTRLFLALFFVTLTVTLVSLYAVSLNLLCYFSFFVFILSGYCPVMFVRWQIYKDNIYGPWDEAIINNSNEFDEFT